MMQRYIDELDLDDINYLNLDKPEENPQIRSFLLKIVASYIQSYYRKTEIDVSDFRRPFEFDTGGTYISFCESCKSYYQNKNQRNPLPSVLDFTLKYIQEISEHYKIFGHFYDIRSEQTANKIVRKMEITAGQKASEAVSKAIYAVTQEAAKTEVENAIDKKMGDVTKKISETSVTILGMFTGIVLTIVAELFYSSSVIDSINSASFYKLAAISSIIGFVCYNLIALMFHYMERFRRNNKTKTSRFSIVVVLVDVVLIGMIIYFSSLHLKLGDNSVVSNIDDTKIDVNISIPEPGFANDTYNVIYEDNIPTQQDNEMYENAETIDNIGTMQEDANTEV